MFNLAQAHRENKCYPPCSYCQVSYVRAEAEALLTALFNGGTVDGNLRPDASMPGGSKPNPSRLNGLAAELIDVSRGWQAAELDTDTRAACWLHHGQGLTHAAIGAVQAVSTSTARRRVERGVGAVLANMNGRYYEEDEEAHDD